MFPFVKLNKLSISKGCFFLDINHFSRVDYTYHQRVIAWDRYEYLDAMKYFLVKIQITKFDPKVKFPSSFYKASIILISQT